MYGAEAARGEIHADTHAPRQHYERETHAEARPRRHVCIPIDEHKMSIESHLKSYAAKN